MTLNFKNFGSSWAGWRSGCGWPWPGLGQAGMGEGTISDESAGQLKLGAVVQPGEPAGLAQVATTASFSTESLAFPLWTGDTRSWNRALAYPVTSALGCWPACPGALTLAPGSRNSLVRLWDHLGLEWCPPLPLPDPPGGRPPQTR